MPSEEISFDVYQKGILVNSHSGKIAQVMKGRREEPWYRVRLSCRDYKVLHSKKRGYYVELENYIPTRSK